MKIQKVLHNFVFFFLTVAIFSGIVPRSYAQLTTGELLASADSLFEARQYTQSFKLYDQLFREDQVVSPAVLMKMAFIRESMGDYSEALYFLNEYFLLTSDESAVQKMQQLSEQHNLRGYEYTDYDLFYNYFREHRYVFIYLLIALAMVGLIYLALTRKQQASKPRTGKPYAWGTAYLILLGLLFFITNYSLEPQQAIIMADHTYIMNAPSSGAEVVYVSEKGHRVEVDGQEDVWTQITWEGEPAFVRQGNLRKIHP